MYGKLENNALKYAPHYLILNNKTILNPQENDYINAGYKEVVYGDMPLVEADEGLDTSYVEQGNKIQVVYEAVSKFTTAQQREEEFYNNFISTSWGNFRKQPKGYQSAVEAVNCVFNMVNILGSFTSDLAPLLIFYQTPDFNDETQCSEDWLSTQQITPNATTKEEFLSWYSEFQIKWAQTQYTTMQISV